MSVLFRKCVTRDGREFLEFLAYVLDGCWILCGGSGCYESLKIVVNLKFSFPLETRCLGGYCSNVLKRQQGHHLNGVIS